MKTTTSMLAALFLVLVIALAPVRLAAQQQSESPLLMRAELDLDAAQSARTVSFRLAEQHLHEAHQALERIAGDAPASERITAEDLRVRIEEMQAHIKIDRKHFARVHERLGHLLGAKRLHSAETLLFANADYPRQDQDMVTVREGMASLLTRERDLLAHGDALLAQAESGASARRRSAAQQARDLFQEALRQDSEAPVAGRLHTCQEFIRSSHIGRNLFLGVLAGAGAAAGYYYYATHHQTGAAATAGSPGTRY